MKLPVQFGSTSFTGPKNQFSSVFNEFKKKVDLSVTLVEAGDKITLKIEGNELEELGVIPLMYGDLEDFPEKLKVLETVTDALSDDGINKFKAVYLKE